MKKFLQAVKFLVVLEVLNKILLSSVKWLSGYPANHFWTNDVDAYVYIAVYFIAVLLCFMVPILYRFIFGAERSGASVKTEED